MDAAADGNLTQRRDPNSDSQAMTDIAAPFNDMIADVEDTITNIGSFADDIAPPAKK